MEVLAKNTKFRGMPLTVGNGFGDQMGEPANRERGPETRQSIHLFLIRYSRFKDRSAVTTEVVATCA